MWREIVPTSVYLPPPPSKVGNKIEVIDLLPPLETREICWIFLDVLKSMNFGSKLFQTALTTIHLQTEVNKSLLGLRGKIIQ